MRNLGPAIQELFDMTGRVAVVTGGCRGLGLDEAGALVDLGAQVVVTSRRGDDAQKAAETLSMRAKVSVVGMALDVTDETSVENFFKKLIEQFGRVDVLVNNAGGAPMSGKVGIFDRELKHWEAVLRTNLTGAFLCTRAVAKQMKGQKSGSVINISSVTALLGRDPRMYEGLDMRANIVDYNAAKAGLLGLTRECAAWLGPFGVRVNAVLPGGFERGQPAEFIRRYSDKVPLRRMGRDHYDIKGVIALLASDAGAYISGESILVDGGFRIFK